MSESEWDHAVDDAQEYLHDRIKIIDEHPIRFVGPADTRLVCAHSTAQAYVTKWIDRRSKWGNPFKIKKDGGEWTREESVELYRGLFLGKVELGELDPEELRGETLGCWCIPRRCHGMVILNYLAEKFEPQQTLVSSNDTLEESDGA